MNLLSAGDARLAARAGCVASSARVMIQDSNVWPEGLGGRQKVRGYPPPSPPLSFSLSASRTLR